MSGAESAMQGNPMQEHDLAIIGAGTAGLTAARVAAAQGLDVLVIERMAAGGQVMNVDAIELSPGICAEVSGFEWGPQLQEQAEAAGAQFMLANVEGLTLNPGARHLLHCGDTQVAARAVLVAAGSARRPLGVPGEEALTGRGVSHCASCDGPLFRGATVCVAGGGDSAVGEARALAEHAARVYLVFPGDAPHAQPALVEPLRALPQVHWKPQSKIIDILGDTTVTGVLLQRTDGSTEDLAVQGVFVYAGLQADTAFLGDALQLDAEGRIVTDAAMKTSVPGVFAAGDIRAGCAYRLTAAAQDGEAAAQAIGQYLPGHQGTHPGCTS